MKKNNRLLILIVVILVIWNVILTVVLANKQEKEINQTNINETVVTGFSTDLTKVIEQTKSSVVVIETNNALSSGFIYSSNNGSTYVVTTCHSVSDTSYLNVVFASGASYDAKIVGKDIFADIAVLQVDSNVEVTPVKLGNSDLLKDGEFLVCIGTPKNIQYSYSNEMSIVASKLRTIINSVEFNDEQYEYYTNIIQLSSDVSEGYSGSPIINMNGEVQGIITMKDDIAVFALPINEVKIVVDNIIDEKEYAKIQFGYKGTLVSGLENYEKNQLNIPLDVISGLYINNVRSAGIASSAGLKIGDVLLSINGIDINSYSDLLNIEYTNADTFEFVVNRNNEEIVLAGSIND